MSRYLLVCCLLGACTQTRNLAASELEAGVAGDAQRPTPDSSPPTCATPPCPACSNGEDDDGDELVDGFDPECTSPNDQFEDSFASGVHGEDKTQKCRDCFFDENSGVGNDGCARAHSCSTTGTSESGSGACRACAVDMTCSTRCEPLVPNGCDCFGCCGVWRGSEEKYVLLAESCSLEALDDPLRCTPCLPASDCANPCGRCELCAGRKASDLPADCQQPGGPGYSCDEGEVCRSSADCSGAEYCQQGCCLTIGI